MNKFLSEVAKYINLKHTGNLHQILVLMPNRRSCLFLEEEFTKLLGQNTTWLPKIISLKDWINQNSVLSKADELVLLFYLYQQFKEKDIVSNIAFDDFLYLGKIILNDFNDVDNECVDAKKLFSNINEYEKLKEQFPILDEISKIFFKDNFLIKEDKLESYKKIWNSIGNVYFDYTNFLKEKRIAYDGLINRYFYENEVDKINLTFNIFFVGFNELYKSEQLIIEKISKKNNFTFLWEYDNWYIENELNNSGQFLRQWIKKYPNPEGFIVKNNSIKNKKIFLYEFENEVSQVKYLPELLKNTVNKNEENKVAIVLLNEKLLQNVLNSLPSNIKNVNVTMGYSMSNTWTFSFIKNLFNLYQKQKNGEVNSNLLLNFLYHPFLVKYDWSVQLVNNVKECSKYTYKIQQNSEEILFNEIKIFLIENQDFKDKVNTLLSILKTIENSLSFSSEAEKKYVIIEIQAIRKICNTIEKFSELVNKLNIKFNYTKTWLNLILQICNAQKIDLIGEPLSGIQIMGLLETRLLDFENVIVLSLNEEHTGSKYQFQTLILNSFRKYYGLPTVDKYEAITAFHFYQLLQRSSDVYLSYARLIDDKPAEPSVYVRQIQYDKNILVNEVKPSLSFKITVDEFPITISKKDKNWQEFLNDASNLVFSRNTISDFIICSLRFYFKYVLKLKSSNFFIEPIQQIELGNEIHNVIKKIFSANKIIELKDYDKVNLDEIIQENENIQTINETIKKLQVKQYVKNFLEFEKNQMQRQYPLDVINIEEFLSYEILMNDRKIKLKGKPDLILKDNNAVYIIDFKLSTSAYVQKIEDISELFKQDEKYKYAFQLAFYAYLFKMNEKNEIPIYMENVFMDKLQDKLNNIIMIGNKVLNFSSDIVKNFENELNKTIENMLNEQIPFEQTKEIKNCEYCEFNVICRKN